MSSAIKATIQHQAALARIEEMHRWAATTPRLHVPAKSRRHRANGASPLVRIRSLQPGLRGGGA